MTVPFLLYLDLTNYLFSSINRNTFNSITGQIKTFVSADDTYLYYSASFTGRALLWRLIIASGINQWNQIRNSYRFEWISEIAHNSIFMIGYDINSNSIAIYSMTMEGKHLSKFSMKMNSLKFSIKSFILFLFLSKFLSKWISIIFRHIYSMIN